MTAASTNTTAAAATTSNTETPLLPSPSPVILNEDWEEWDGTTPFWHHCLAGSFAGVAEHGLVYPLDTVRTHLQVCAHCPNQPSPSSSSAGATTTSSSSAAMKTAATRSQVSSLIRPVTTSTSSSTNTIPPQGMWRTMRHLMSLPVPSTTTTTTTGGLLSDATAAATATNTARVVGVARLWRGVQTILLGCVPAHALYFSSFEAVKYSFTNSDGILPWYGSMLAGATATISHDVILTPLDTIKQRLQLGHYQGMSQAMRHMIQYEGWSSLYRSFSITLLTNIPYGMIMVTTNESCKTLFLQRDQQTNPHATLTWTATVVSSSLAGMMASFWTTPLDRIKTYLQVQQLQPACQEGSCPLIGHAALPSSHHNNLNGSIASWPQALQKLLQQPQGLRGLWQGALPRVLSHTPSVAISWTTYEAAKQYLAAHYSSSSSSSSHEW